MGFLIDTSVFISLERQKKTSDRFFAELVGEPVAISAITASELLHGVERADNAIRRGKREAFVEIILKTVPVLPVDLEVARIHAKIWADLRSQGKIIGAHDMLIAATALVYDLRILTGNVREFERVEGLEVVKWKVK
jgi:tRNA(fMet)-specific endonuclease VapC